MFIQGGVITSSPNIFGARMSPINLTNDAWRLDLNSRTWGRIIPAGGFAPPALAGHTLTTAANGYLYLIGGRTASPGFSSAVYTFIPSSVRWARSAVFGRPSVNVSLYLGSIAF